jgi:hypothetical protein
MRVTGSEMISQPRNTSEAKKEKGCCPNSDTRPRYYPMGRLLLIVVGALLLTGCFDDQKQQLAKCEIEATRQYPDQEFVKSVEHIRLCMRAAGYEWDLSDVRCDGILARNPYCYVPIRSVAKWLYRQEVDPK